MTQANPPCDLPLSDPICIVFSRRCLYIEMKITLDRKTLETGKFSKKE
jgi:hypothetical protein